jgi:hypothetical protein
MKQEVIIHGDDETKNDPTHDDDAELTKFDVCASFQIA